MSYDSAPHVPAERVIVLHGYTASPESHWFPWLSETLGSHGIAVTVVELPDSSTPTVSGWGDAVHAATGQVDERTWLVGHSLGCVTALRYLAGLSEPWTLGGLVLVAGFTGRLGNIPELDRFLEEEVDVEAFADNILSRIVIRSDDDTVVPPAATAVLAARLGVESVVVPGAGHFTAKNGITSLPIVAEVITANGHRRLAPAAPAPP